jgi:hypothetical protein
LSLGVGDLVSVAAVVYLLIACVWHVHCKHPITPNAAAELTPFGITAP